MRETRTAVIIGSTSGIGLGVARALVVSSANFVIYGVATVEEMQELTSQIQNEHDNRVYDCDGDLMKGEGVNALMGCGRTVH